jgi:hypothetical protein
MTRGRSGPESNRSVLAERAGLYVCCLAERARAVSGGIAFQERPEGRSRWNRTITRADMSRGRAQHRLRTTGKLRCSGFGVRYFTAARYGCGNRTSSARLVPPRGHDPLPSSFANLCPVLGTVASAIRSGRSGGSRTRARRREAAEIARARVPRARGASPAARSAAHCGAERTCVPSLERWRQQLDLVAVEGVEPSVRSRLTNGPRQG